MESNIDTGALTNGLNWLIALLLLGAATIGPKIIGPWIDWIFKDKSKTEVRTDMMLIGGSLGNRESMTELTEAINRLTDVLEKRYQLELAEDEESKMRRRLQEIMEEMKRRETNDPKGI